MQTGRIVPNGVPSIQYMFREHPAFYIVTVMWVKIISGDYFINAKGSIAVLLLATAVRDPPKSMELLRNIIG